MTVVPLPPRGEWLRDARDGDRGLRVSFHPEQGCAVLSTWHGGTCTGTARLDRNEVARLVGVLAAGLATGTTSGGTTGATTGGTTGATTG